MTSQWEAQVVGINYYPNFTSLQQLTAAANDAEAVAIQLEQYGYQTFRVQRLPHKPNQKGEWQVNPDEGVKMEDLQAAIGNLLMPPDGNPPETALFFFSGHGWRKTVNGKDRVFLATSDVLPSDRNYGISINWLGNLIQNSPVKKLIVWLDCCYSGELGNYLPTDKDYCIFTATRSYEPGIEIKHQEGLFTRELREGLNPHNYPDGIVDSHKLAKYIQERMAQAGQSPQCYNSARSILLTSKVRGKDPKDECPYRSLSCFTEQPEDANVFYGRTKLTLDLVQRVRNKERLIAVFGASGSGKSSLIRAGLLYQLKLGQEIVGSNNWVYFDPFTPTDDPLARLHQVLGIDPPPTIPNRSGKVAPATNLVQFFKQSWGELTPIILIVDQFEECFTMCNEEEQKVWIDCLTELIETIPNLQLIIGMRSDFRGRLREYPQFAQHMSKVNVGHLNREEIQEAIEKPAEFVGLRIEGSLKQQLINDVEDYPGSLPLLQYTLTELWNESRKQGERFLWLATYKGLGGIEGTLEKRADAVYESLLPEERAVTKRIFLELTHLGDRLDTRRRVRLGDLVNSHHSSAILEQVTQKLANQENRLITRTSIEKAEDPLATEIIIDVVHEALIRHWKQLGEWNRQYQAAMVIERKIESAAKDWEDADKKTEYLLQRSKLGEAEEYIKNFSNLGMLDGMAEEFISESQNLRDTLAQQEAAQKQRELDILEEKRKAEETARQAAEQRAEEQARSNQKLRQRANILKIVSAVALGIASLAGYFWWDASRAKTTAELKEQVANVQAQLPIATNVSPLILALATVGKNLKFNQDLFPEVKSSLLNAIEVVRERNIFKEHKGWVQSVSVSADGKTIVSGGQDGKVWLSDRNGKAIGHPLTVPKRAIYSVAVSADGQTIVSGDSDGKVWLSDRNGKEIGQPFTVPKGTIYSVAVSNDNKTIVSGGSDGKVWLSDRNGKAIGKPFTAHTSGFLSVAINADGQTIVTGGRNDQTVKVWTRNGKEIGKPFQKHKTGVYSVAVSADGQTIVSGWDDGTVRLSDRNGQVIGQSFTGKHSSSVAVAVSADGQTILSGGYDGKVRLSDRNSQVIGQPFTAYPSSLLSVAVSNDGQTIVTGGEEGTVRLSDRWGLPIDRPFYGHGERVNGAAVSADGQTIFIGGEDGTIHLWNRDGKRIGQLFKGSQRDVRSIAVSSNGQTIVTINRDSMMRLYRSGKEIGGSFRLGDGVVNSVAVSADGQTIASVRSDGIVELWNDYRKSIGNSFPNKVGRNAVYSVAFSADGQTIFTGGEDGIVKLWNLNGKEIGQLFRHESPVKAIAVSADGQTIFSGDETGKVRLSDRAGKGIGSLFQGSEVAISALAISNDSQTIVIVDRNGKVRLGRAGWKDLVVVGCDRLLLHPDFTSPLTKDATEEEKISRQESVETCLEHGGWKNSQKAEFLVRQGSVLAKENGDVEGAKTKFKEAQKLEAGTNLAQLEVSAGKLAAPKLVEKGKTQVVAGNVTEALTLYNKAQKLDPTLKINADDWNRLCSQGSIYHRANDVLFACENAVKLASAEDKGNYQESRGLAKAVAGDKQGAIADFQAYINDPKSNSTYKAQHKQWIEALKKGENPFTEEVLQSVKDQ